MIHILSNRARADLGLHFSPLDMALRSEEVNLNMCYWTVMDTLGTVFVDTCERPLNHLNHPLSPKY